MPDHPASNRLANETSPYLLQHQHNPVNWWPWCDEAFATAAREDKPVFLSIGYAACHWCHVMERESFENDTIAAILNASFICIKVDREERPDIDQLYMEALHRLGEQGGWPLSMFITPDRKPFWGGTYFPPEHRYGRPSFPHVLNELSRIWTTERDKIDSNADSLAAALQQTASDDPAAITDHQMREGTAIIVRACDHLHGGIKGAPKFPQAPLFERLWQARHHSPDAGHIVELTLSNIRKGGIYDHIGGGLARYSVDGEWLVPHFEKMLYDNAQYISLASKVAAQTKDDGLANSVGETVGFILRELMTTDGAFGSSYDADSEGVEGKFYVWSKQEVEDHLGAEASRFCATYDISEHGNWEGTNIPNLLHHPGEASPDLAVCRSMLYEKRSARIPPAFDDKILLDWNALAISALAQAGLIFQNPNWIIAAVTVYQKLNTLLFQDKRWHHSFRAGQAKHFATAEGLANLVSAAIMLHSATADRSYISDALTITASLEADYLDQASNCFFLSSRHATDLLTRKITIQDDATPNANGTIALNYVKLFLITADDQFRTRADHIISNFATLATSHPFAASTLMRAAHLLSHPVHMKIMGQGKNLLTPALIARSGDGVLEHVPSDTSAAIICIGQECSAPLANAASVDDYLQSRSTTKPL